VSNEERLKLMRLPERIRKHELHAGHNTTVLVQATRSDAQAAVFNGTEIDVRDLPPQAIGELVTEQIERLRRNERGVLVIVLRTELGGSGKVGITPPTPPPRPPGGTEDLIARIGRLTNEAIDVLEHGEEIGVIGHFSRSG
jgi:hypothetical protein